MHDCTCQYLDRVKMAAYAEAFDEFQSVSDVTHTSLKAKIHCVVSGIPEEMKQGSGSSYFDGKLSDNERSIRIYGYDPTVRRKLFTSQTQENRAIRLTTAIEKSEKVFTVPPARQCLCHCVPIANIYKLPVQTFVDINITVCSIEELEFIPIKHLNCQQMTVADSTASICLTVWENEVITMEQGKS